MRPDHCTFTDEAFPHVVKCGEPCSDPCPKHVLGLVRSMGAVSMRDKELPDWLTKLIVEAHETLESSARMAFFWSHSLNEGAFDAIKGSLQLVAGIDDALVEWTPVDRLTSVRGDDDDDLDLQDDLDREIAEAFDEPEEAFTLELTKTEAQCLLDHMGRADLTDIDLDVCQMGPIAKRLVEIIEEAS